MEKKYLPYEIVDYVFEKKKEAQFLQNMAFCKNGFTMTEVADAHFERKEDGLLYLEIPSYRIETVIQDDDVETAVANGLYISTFLARHNDSMGIHFLFHDFPTSMKGDFEEEIVEKVVRFMIVRTVKALRLDTPAKVDAYIRQQ